MWEQYAHPSLNVWPTRYSKTTMLVKYNKRIAVYVRDVTGQVTGNNVLHMHTTFNLIAPICFPVMLFLYEPPADTMGVIGLMTIIDHTS